MKKGQLPYLLKEYRRAQELKEALQFNFQRLQTAVEIRQDLNKELHSELQRAKEAKDQKMENFWGEVAESCFELDRDKPDEAEFLEETKRVEKSERLMAYYDKKIKIIRRLMGTRLAELIDIYDEKNLLLGGGSSSKSNMHEIEEEEERQQRRIQKKKNSATFDKM